MLGAWLWQKHRRFEENAMYSPLQDQQEVDSMQAIKCVHWQEDGSWLGYLQEFPDYWTQGDTLAVTILTFKATSHR